MNVLNVIICKLGFGFSNSTEMMLKFQDLGKENNQTAVLVPEILNFLK